MSSRVELFEHETVRVGDRLRSPGGAAVQLSQRDWESLVRFNDAHGGRYFEVGHRSIKTTQHVGYVEVGDLCIEILPKADRHERGPARPWRDGLLEMLRVATGLRLATPDDASQSASRPTLIELVATRFLDELQGLLREGLAKGYREDESNGAVFRGKLLVQKNVRENLVRADRFYVRHVVYDRNVPVNRILRAALDALRGLALSPSVSSRVVACCQSFPEVAESAVTPETFERLELGRSTARYHDALWMARLLLERRAPSLRAGRVPVFALLFDMNALWERYVSTLIRRVAEASVGVSTQERGLFWKADGMRRVVRPDVVVRATAPDRVVLVADTKWKVPLEGAPADADLKQMFVYNELFGSPRSALVYPNTGRERGLRGGYHARSHDCTTLHLGLFREGRWDALGIEEQLRAFVRECAGTAVTR